MKEVRIYQINVNVKLHEDPHPYKAQGLYVDKHNTPVNVIKSIVIANLKTRKNGAKSKFEVFLHEINTEFIMTSNDNIF
jgi:hypothetical protein